jgi:S1-C subfamily serine protease
MNKLLLLTLCSTLSLSAIANNESIRPSRVTTNLFKVNIQKKISDKGVKVSGVQYSKRYGTYERYGDSFYIPENTFDRAHGLANSVFRATPGDDSNSHGTAFAVGGNLVLTNQHVLSTSRKNTTKCKSFRIKLNENQKNKTLYCKEVHYCSRPLDFCLIEMKDHRKGYSLTKEKAFKLTSTIPYGDHTETMIIGNTRGFGLHASKGIGIEKDTSLFKFYAPVWGGNSGGPIFNKFNEVIGVVRSQSKKYVSEESYNTGIGMDTILGVLKRQLKNKPAVLNKLNL